MRTWLAGVTAFLVACSAHAQTNNPVHITVAAGSGGAAVAASGGDTPGGTWINAAPAQTRIVVGADGQTYVGVWIDVPQQQGAVVRAPVDLALVVDTSGSMSGDKISNARIAASSMLETLADGDIVSIYAFNNAAEQIAPPTVVSAATRPMLMQSVNSLVPMGGTDMYDGLRAGEGALNAAPPTHAVRRLVLISDGLANIGPSSATELGDVAGLGTEAGVQVSAIGVGVDYDESTLGALALRSSGRLYHLEQPAQMAEILRTEMARLSTTVASDAYIEIEAAPGVQLLDAEGASAQNDGAHLRVALGSLAGGQHREMLVRVRLPTTGAGERALGNARLVFREPAGARNEHAQAVPLRYAVTSDARTAAASANDRVRAMVTNYEAAQAQLRAVQMLNQGQTAAAAQQLAQAENDLNAAAAQTHDSSERERLRRTAAHVARARADVSAPAPAAAQSGRARAAALRVNADAYRDMLE